MYSDKVLDHFTNPRNVGEMTNADATGEFGSSHCGDTIKVFLKIENSLIQDIRFKTFGCAAAIASSSMMTEMVRGKTLEEALKLTNEMVAEALDGLPPEKMHCSCLAADGLHKAIKNYLDGNK
ncbi:MAG: Fe-S cluster assembly scaffold protein NifU [Desulfuromonadaceae bacterium]|nr:Fe-S cluster assembly scaffold protein NifU [Desulfuromonadaceae bacterium]